MGVSGWMFLLVPAYPGCPGSKAVKRSLLLLLLLLHLTLLTGHQKSNQPVKNWVILCWYGYLSEVQMIHIWPADSWCHCHPIISWFTKIQNGLPVPFWCKLTQEAFVLITNFKALCPSYKIPQWPPALQDDADVSQLGDLAPNDSVVVVDVGRLPPPNS